MDYVKDAKTVWQLLEDQAQIDPIVLEKVDAAMKLLHQNDIVFGDLRDANVLFAPSPGNTMAGGRVYLVDFDWASRAGVGRFPATLDRENYDGSMQPYGIMEKDHDTKQFESLSQSITRNTV
ncbi:hypothetical protein HYPSUDRAFT_133001 [Hypholoma sublateritium FD-334 SS-4]|uniref:Protein kinase domain-containing protein n=1 Tax=Hypholoma sublateritium (strain FD-334 SS-4) TaxID=945553 RepID=A0A0D2LFG7_HYPSF|nr:hypothetical protein HYPSUDRAFT_133001 [Hypholoma sublateritium FD-334 SS-4]